MKFLISVLLIGLTVAACKPAEDENKTNPDKVINETDYSSCGSGNYGTSIAGTWYYQQSVGTAKFTKTYSFSRDYARVTNDCVFDGVPVRATASSRIVVGVNSLAYLDSALNENSIQREGYKITCQSKIEPADFTWRFQGNCLVIIAADGKSSIALLPAAKN